MRTDGLKNPLAVIFSNTRRTFFGSVVWKSKNVKKKNNKTGFVYNEHIFRTTGSKKKTRMEEMGSLKVHRRAKRTLTHRERRNTRRTNAALYAELSVHTPRVQNRRDVTLRCVRCSYSVVPPRTRAHAHYNMDRVPRYGRYKPYTPFGL